MSDDQILEQIISTHVHSDTKFDVGPLSSLVNNTLTRSTHIVDGAVQGISQVSLDHVDENKSQANFSSPLCTLRQISSEAGDLIEEAEGRCFSRWMRNAMTSDNPTRAIDEKLGGSGYEEKMLLALKIACLCTLDDPKERPNSKDVRCMLSKIKH